MSVENQGLSANERAIITSSLQLSTPRWTSVDIAQLVGTSQSAVARTWRRTFDPNPLPTTLPRKIDLVGVRYQNGQGLIAARVVDSNSINRISQPAMRSPRRITFQALLAALPLQEDQVTANTRMNLDSFLPQLKSSELLIIHSDPAVKLEQRFTTAYVSQSNWQSLLGYLITASSPTSARNLRELHQELIRWAKDPSRSFTWIAADDLNQTQTPHKASSATVRSTQQVIADEVFENIVANIWSGKLTAGDRITESSLAKELHTTRNQTRDALRSLASSGLVDHHPVRGVLVPTPKKSDVADIYAARRALGTEILRRVVEKSDFNIEAVSSALSRVVQAAKTGNSYETGNADLQFQDVIAENSGMRNIPQLFGVLAKQLRIYIAVMGLGYVYSIEAMVKDDTALYNHLKNRNFSGAREVWHQKLDDSLQFMTGHIGKKK